MIIETPLDLKQKVYIVLGEEVRETCPYCGGTESVVGVAGDALECMACYEGTVGCGRLWKVAQRTVNSIKIEMHEMYDGSPSLSCSYKFLTGTHGYYPSQKVFATKAEAQAECDGKNAQRETANAE